MILSKESLFWCMGLAAAVIAIFAGAKVNSWAAGEEQVSLGAHVTAVPVQLGRESYGLAMIDPKSESIWIYEVNMKGAPHSRLKLVAARSWHYDKMLEEYNSGEPKPQDVKNIIEQLLKSGGSAGHVEANGPDITSVAEPNKVNE